jgi:hypothetical protein
MIFQVLSTLISTGDGMWRCIVLGIAESISGLINQITNMDDIFISSLMNFFGRLTNDSLFSKLFTESFFLNASKILHFLKSTYEKTKLISGFLSPIS